MALEYSAKLECLGMSSLHQIGKTNTHKTIHLNCFGGTYSSWMWVSSSPIMEKEDSNTEVPIKLALVFLLGT